MKNLQKVGKEIFSILKQVIAYPKSELNFGNEFECLIAVMLSAQCTDKRVNIITDRLFRLYNTPKDFAKLSIEQMEDLISSCNFYRNKAKNIIATSQIIVDKYDGRVPSAHKDLVSLPGVGEKTASVVEAVAFNQPALPVDTHVLRVSNRLGLVATKNPSECSRQLREIFDKNDWVDLHHLILLFGRYYCTARSPKCTNCALLELCQFEQKNIKK